MADKRVFTIEINGVDKSYQDVDSLLKALSQLPPLIDKVNKSSVSSTQVTTQATRQSRERKAALTEEEKAENKLAQTIDRVANARTEANRAQVDAAAAARNAQREVQLEQNVINASANSIKEMTAKLALLRHEWDNTDIDSERFAELNVEIATLTDRISQARQATGDYRMEVGHYQNATEGLQEQMNQLSESVNQATEQSQQMLTLFQAGVTTFAMFGDESESTKEILTNVSKVMALLSLAQQINNGILSKNIVLNKARIVTDALVSRGLITQTTAQTALNVATKSFPLLAIIALLGTFIATTSNATAETKKYTSALDGTSFSTKEAKEQHDGFVRSIRDIQIEIDLASGKLTDYQARLKQIRNIQSDEEAKLIEQYSKDVDAINEKYKSLGFIAKDILTTGDSWVERDNRRKKEILERDSKFISDKEKLQETSDENTRKETIDNNKKVNKINEDARIASLDGFKQTEDKIKQRRDEALEDAKRSGADETLINKQYDKELADARKSASKEANDKRLQQLEKRKAILQKELDLVRKSEDDETSLISDEFKRRTSEIHTQYKRQREDLERQLATEKDLTESGKKAIREMIANIDLHESEDQKKLLKEQNAKLLSEQKSYLDMTYAEYQQFYDTIADMPKEVKLTNGLIDVESSKRNFDLINTQLNEYILNLNSSKTEITKYYDDLIKTYEVDSLEYNQAVHDKTTALHSVDREIKAVNTEIADNTKEKADLAATYWEEYSQRVQKVAEIATMISDAMFSGMDAIMQSSVDSAKEKLEELNKAYDDAVAKREESDSRLEALSERAKSSEGNRSAALITQLNQEMEKNKALSDQESALAKKKEKLEAEIEKKEKKQKKAAAAQQVLQAIINTSVASTAALPNIALSTLIKVLGGIEIGIASANYAKMEKGGYLDGERHSQGGMKIQGTNIEVEGGEYVVNREATRQNRPLLEYINTYNTVPQLPTNKVNVTELVTNNYNATSPNIDNSNIEIGRKLDVLTQTMSNINLSPIVSVVDINSVQQSVSAVDNITSV